MICVHHNEDPCSTCAGFDMYIPKKVVNREDVEYYGAWFWYNHSRFWMEKYLDENRCLRKMQEDKGDRA